MSDKYYPNEKDRWKGTPVEATIPKWYKLVNNRQITRDMGQSTIISIVNISEGEVVKLARSLTSDLGCHIYYEEIKVV